VGIEEPYKHDTLDRTTILENYLIVQYIFAGEGSACFIVLSIPVGFSAKPQAASS